MNISWEPMISILACLPLLTACDSKRTANAADFEQALTGYYSDHPECATSLAVPIAR
jgi:hypothetical protein